jgi:hypothetical protein
LNPPLKVPLKTTLKEGSPGRGSLASAEDRRRSQRMMLRVSVVLHFIAEGKPAKLEAHSVAVNVHGAMICSGRSLPPDTRLEIEHKLSGERLPGRVTRQPQSTSEGYLIPVEFDSPSTEFWHISFPPSDWKPPDA